MGDDDKTVDEPPETVALRTYPKRIVKALGALLLRQRVPPVHHPGTDTERIGMACSQRKVANGEGGIAYPGGNEHRIGRQCIQPAPPGPDTGPVRHGGGVLYDRSSQGNNSRRPARGQDRQKERQKNPRRPHDISPKTHRSSNLTKSAGFRNPKSTFDPPPAAHPAAPLRPAPAPPRINSAAPPATEAEDDTYGRLIAGISAAGRSARYSCRNQRTRDRCTSIRATIELMAFPEVRSHFLTGSLAGHAPQRA